LLASVKDGLNVRGLRNLPFQAVWTFADPKYFLRLDSDGWLSDVAIETYGALISLHFSRVSFLSPFALSSYESGNRFQRIAWTPLHFDWVLSPLQVHGNHWIMLAAHISSRKITVMDSINCGTASAENVAHMQRFQLVYFLCFSKFFPDFLGDC
jgi:hypothetical protein